MRKLLTLLLLATLLGVAAGCGGDDDEPAADEGAPTGAVDTGAAEPDPCAPDQLTLVSDGTLTIGTDNPAFPPWFQDAEGAPWDPTTEPTQQGYEAAVAYAVAEELGFSDDQVEWVVVPFAASFRPGPKDFDFDVNQISYVPARDEAVDFSDSYYDAIVNTIQPEQDPSVYDRNDDAVNALRNGQIDGIVVDYPTSLFITAVQAPNATTIGRLPAEGQEYFGLVFEEGNPLRDCVNDAIASLRDSGTLDDIAQEWIEGSAPPILE